MGRDSRLNPNSWDFRGRINRNLERQWDERADRYEDDRIHNRGAQPHPSRSRRWVVALLAAAAALAMYALVR
jgi:hypothetical protein